MFDKETIFRGQDEEGNVFCYPLIEDGFVKTAAASDSRLHPEIKEFVRAFRPSKHGIYVLVSALGAGEFWGSNVNGDLFPEAALIHAPDNWLSSSREEKTRLAKTWEYGYPTFLNAAPYKHHQNKDKNKAFGTVELAVWNPEMHRVELIVYLDRELCKEFGAYDIIERIENGEYPDVSMGCRVPYDVCTICGHKSKTRKDYCEHALNMMNKILPDGRKVAVRNDSPRFFDISFVFIGADKTAKVMMHFKEGLEKAAAALLGKPHPPIKHLIPQEMKAGVREEKEHTVDNTVAKQIALDHLAENPHYYAILHRAGLMREPLIDKTAGARRKTASHRKLSEITKSIPAGPFTERTLPKLESAEKDIPNPMIDKMVEKGLGPALSTAGMLGLILKPKEFQRLLLIQIGEKDLAEKLDSEGKVFSPSTEIDESIPIDKDMMDEDLKEMLKTLVEDRSIAAPSLRRRTIRITISNSPKAKTEVNEPVMKKIAAAYNGYRSNLIKKANQIENSLVSDSQLLSNIFGKSMVEAFASGIGKTASASVLGPESFAYLVGAFQNPDISLSKEAEMSLTQMGIFSEAMA